MLAVTLERAQETLKSVTATCLSASSSIDHHWQQTLPILLVATLFSILVGLLTLRRDPVQLAGVCNCDLRGQIFGMSLLQAELPSEDEGDDDYDPARDEKDGAGPAKAKQAGTKRRRGSVAYPEAPAQEAAFDEAPEHVDKVDSPATLAKKGKVDQLWAQLNKGKPPPATVTALRKDPEAAISDTAMPAAAGSKQFNLAAFCRPVPKKQKIDSDAVRQMPQCFGYALGSCCLCLAST